MKTHHGPRVSIPLFLLSALLSTFLFSAIANAQAITYSNTTPIGLPNDAVASTYPSTINVSGSTGQITRVKVTLHGFTQRPSDMDVLLVAPGNVKVLLMRSQGGSTAVNDVTFTFDDYAAGQIGATLASGTFRPSPAGTGVSLPAPAPANSSPSYVRALRDLTGRTANGDWSLYIDDAVSQGSAGSVAGGWSLEITYGRVYTSTTQVNVPASGSSGIASPYPSPINVSGMPTSPMTKVSVLLNGLQHRFADDVAVLLVGPGGQKVKILSDSGGSGEFIFTFPYLFDSTASSTMADYLTSGDDVPGGIYRPSNGTSSSPNDEGNPMPANFPSPAPAGPYDTDLGVFAGTQPNGWWFLYAYDDSITDIGSIRNWSLIFETLVPTSAPVELSGTVSTMKGQGIRGVVVTAQDGKETFTTVTSTFGRYRFPALTAGRTYIVSVNAKRYSFENPVRVVNMHDSLTDIDFVSGP